MSASNILAEFSWMILSTGLILDIAVAETIIITTIATAAVAAATAIVEIVQLDLIVCVWYTHTPYRNDVIGNLHLSESGLKWTTTSHLNIDCE